MTVLPNTLVLTAIEEFKKDLEKEIQLLHGKVITQKGRLYLVSGLHKEPVFAQNIWYNPQWIDFTSASDGANKIKGFGKLWSLTSVAHHRRAELIADKLPHLRQKAIAFPIKAEFPPVGGWTLWEPNKLLVAARTKSRFQNGEPIFQEKPEQAPSKAYLKLWEWMTITQKFPQPNDKCLDLGSCPGGWTWVLAELGCQVTSVDKAPLDERLSHHSKVKWLKKDAFLLEPEDIGPIDWLFSDIICYPPKLLELVQKWMKSGLAKNYVCTIKFQGETDFETLEKFRKIPGSHVVHLSCNRHEVTWYKLKPT